MRGVGAWQLVTAIAVVPAAILGPDGLAWTIAGASIALLATGGARRPTPLLSDPQRHLVGCRRRGEPATILVVDAPGIDARRLRALQQSTRVSDSLATKRIVGGMRIYGVLDGDDIQRAAVERRFAEILGDRSVFGWASFPADGYTLELLVEHALTRAAPEAPAWRPPPASAEGQGVLQEVALGSADHANTEGARG